MGGSRGTTGSVRSSGAYGTTSRWTRGPASGRNGSEGGRSGGSTPIRKRSGCGGGGGGGRCTLGPRTSGGRASRTCRRPTGLATRTMSLARTGRPVGSRSAKSRGSLSNSSFRVRWTQRGGALTGRTSSRSGGGLGTRLSPCGGVGSFKATSPVSSYKGT